MVAHSFNPSPWEADESLKFEVSLVYIVSFTLAKTKKQD